MNKHVKTEDSHHVENVYFKPCYTCVNETCASLTMGDVLSVCFDQHCSLMSSSSN